MRLYERRLKTYPKARTCLKCGKLLSIYNLKDHCFSCQEVYVTGYDKRKRKPRKQKADPRFVFRETLCSSRETPGFNKAYFDYHGCLPD